MTSAEPVIRVCDLSKDFMLPHLRRNTVKSHFIHMLRRNRVMEVQHALRNIDFEIGRGEFFGIVGRNGCGKSTLLKILAGIYTPTSGRVSVQGRLVPFLELGVGFNAELTGRENVYLNGAMMGFSKDEVDEIYQDIVDFAELEESMDRKLKNYSSGMQVRIAFSLATRARGDILLVDEVLAVGDGAFQRKCFDHFRMLKDSDTTVVFVTHNMAAVREFCDRAVMIEDSRIVAEGDAESVAEQYTRLFTPAASEAPDLQIDADPENRWGEGDARYAQVVVPEVVTDQAEIEVELEAVALRDVREVVFGFLVSNASGTPILGTNSLVKRQRCGGLSKGEKVKVRWTVPNLFSDGRHTIDISIHDTQGFATYDYWKQAATFTVVKDEKTPYLITPDTTFVLERRAPVA